MNTINSAPNERSYLQSAMHLTGLSQLASGSGKILDRKFREGAGLLGEGALRITVTAMGVTALSSMYDSIITEQYRAKMHSDPEDFEEALELVASKIDPEKSDYRWILSKCFRLESPADCVDQTTEAARIHLNRYSSKMVDSFAIDQYLKSEMCEEAFGQYSRSSLETSYSGEQSLEKIVSGCLKNNHFDVAIKILAIAHGEALDYSYSRFAKRVFSEVSDWCLNDKNFNCSLKITPYLKPEHKVSFVEEKLASCAVLGTQLCIDEAKDWLEIEKEYNFKGSEYEYVGDRSYAFDGLGIKAKNAQTKTIFESLNIDLETLKDEWGKTKDSHPDTSQGLEKLKKRCAKSLSLMGVHPDNSKLPSEFMAQLIEQCVEYVRLNLAD